MPSKAALKFEALPTVEDARLIPFRAYVEPNGTLVPLTAGTEIPFPIARVFYVFGTPAGMHRGEHAHRECHQLLVALSGCIEVTLDDGVQTRTVRLDSPAKGLWIPPGLWAQQGFIDADSMLFVLCDQPFREEDYIREYEAFLEHREGSRK